MSPEKTSTAATDPTPDVPVSTDFCADDADVVIRAAGTLDFRVHKTILSLVSPFFKDMFTLPQPPSDAPGKLPHVDVQEPTETWENILRTIYPMPHPVIDDLDDLQSLFFAARVYDIQIIFDIHKKALENSEFIAEDPLRLFTIAYACGLEAQATYVARNAELLEVTGHPNPTGLRGLTFGAYSRLVSFLVARDNEWHKFLRNTNIPSHAHCSDCNEELRTRFFGRIKEDLCHPHPLTEIYFNALERQSDYPSKCSPRWDSPFARREIKAFIEKMVEQRERTCDKFQPEKWHDKCTTTFRPNTVVDIIFDQDRRGRGRIAWGLYLSVGRSIFPAVSCWVKYVRWSSRSSLKTEYFSCGHHVREGMCAGPKFLYQIIPLLRFQG